MGSRPIHDGQGQNIGLGFPRTTATPKQFLWIERIGILRLKRPRKVLEIFLR